MRDMRARAERPRFAGKVVLISGCGQDLSEATARLCAQHGAAGVLLGGRGVEQGQAVAAIISAAGCPAQFQPTDLTKLDDCAALVAKADEAFGRIDVVIFSAGMLPPRAAVETLADQFDHLFAVNVRAPFFLMRRAAEVMQRDGRARRHGHRRRPARRRRAAAGRGLRGGQAALARLTASFAGRRRSILDPGARARRLRAPVRRPAERARSAGDRGRDRAAARPTAPWPARSPARWLCWRSIRSSRRPGRPWRSRSCRPHWRAGEASGQRQPPEPTGYGLRSRRQPRIPTSPESRVGTRAGQAAGDAVRWRPDERTARGGSTMATLLRTRPPARRSGQPGRTTRASRAAAADTPYTRARALFRFQQRVRAQVPAGALPSVPRRARPRVRSGDRHRADPARPQRPPRPRLPGDHALDADLLRPDPGRRAPDHALQGERRALLRAARPRAHEQRRRQRSTGGRATCSACRAAARARHRGRRRGLRALGDHQRARARLRAPRAAGAGQRGDRGGALPRRRDPRASSRGSRGSSRARRSRAWRWCSRASTRRSCATCCRPSRSRSTSCRPARSSARTATTRPRSRSASRASAATR